MKMIRSYINPDRNSWTEILKRPAFDHNNLVGTVAEILQDVKKNGDAAIRKYTEKFDGIFLENMAVSQAEINEAGPMVDAELKAAIELAKNNISTFHASQKENITKIETSAGVYCWRKSVAIEKVGLYIPGGTAPLFSTLLMLGIPAMLAGCNEIVMCTPPDKQGRINPVILYVANLIGIKNIFKAGGVQAITAMAYGTETVPKVYKIFGPGNQYVTCAKQLVNAEGVAIDMPAGPSELAVYADESCTPAFVAADLLSQAEHGIDSQVVLIASSSSLAERVNIEIEKQLAVLPRKDIASLALQNSVSIIMQDTDEAFDMLNAYAPEHLIIASDDAELVAGKVINAGSVFLGHYSPESAGDYASGTNHTLPTNGYARAYSGVSVDSFVKKITYQQINKNGLIQIGKAVELMAAAEGLQAHKNAVSIRLNEINNGI